jgi:hypothetical protein
LRPASRFVFEDPGIYSSCDYAGKIISELNNAEKLTIYYINTTPKKKKITQIKSRVVGCLKSILSKVLLRLANA